MATKKRTSKNVLKFVGIDDVKNLALNILIPKHSSGNSKRLSMVTLGIGGVGGNIFSTMRNIDIGTSAMPPGSHARYSPLYNYSMTFYDDDKVEYSNLNRVPDFTYYHAIENIHKAAAATSALNVVPSGFKTTWQASPVINRIMGDTAMSVDAIAKARLIIDARDTLAREAMFDDIWVKLAYSGGSDISFTFKPLSILDRVLASRGRDNSYAITPSFYPPAAILGILALRMASFKDLVNVTPEQANTVALNIDSHIQSNIIQWEKE